MILCGSITDSELRARLLALADGMGWDSWLTHEPALLAPMLDALSNPADAIVSDDLEILENLPDHAPARILIAKEDTRRPEDGSAVFVIEVAENDGAMRQHLYNCINATRLKSRSQIYLQIFYEYQ